MAANRGAGTFVSFFLLCCWQDVQPWPNRELSGSKTEQQPSLKILDDDIASVFEVRGKEKKVPKMHEDKPLPPGTIDTLSFDDDEKETLFQMKSLEALEKIIDTIRRAIGTHLKKKRKFQKSRRIRQLLGKLI
ncbi:protein SPACA7-like protein [Cricetulus griseus]|nr:protein SPACA7-like protein [Cricetulus griseus]